MNLGTVSLVVYLWIGASDQEEFDNNLLRDKFC